MDRNPLHGSVIPFARRWHVIHEIDLVRLIEDQRGRLAVCDRAERIADALPQRPDGAALTEVLAALDRLATRGEADVSAWLEAMLLDGGDHLASTVLDHIRQQHVADAAAARELQAALGEGGWSGSPDALGYMLRGFFTACRRAVDFERLTIIALARHRLTPDAHALLVAALAAGAGV